MRNNRKSKMYESQAGTIKDPVPVDKESNIFGVLLKKTPGNTNTNKFLKEAQQEHKQ